MSSNNGARIKRWLIIELADPDDELRVQTDARDVRAWEAEYASSYLATPTSATQMAQVAHLAARRAGAFDDDYATFDKRCVRVAYDSGDAGHGVVLSDPTQPEVMAASSAS